MTDVKTPREFVLGPMRRVIRAVHRDLEDRLAEAGYPEVRAPHINVFAVVPRGEGMRMGDVAAWLQLTPGAVSQLVAHLERLGLVRRVRDPEDGRGVIVVPTRAANEGYETSRRRIGELEDRWVGLVGPRRWRTFRTVLEEIAASQEAAVGLAEP
jgi:DNA-binding MarR family transcriptional regulator